MKRSIVIAGHQTSISIEEPFWKGLREIAAAKDMTLSELVASIDKDRQRNNLSSHIRLYVLEYYQTKVPHKVRQSRQHRRPQALQRKYIQERPPRGGGLSELCLAMRLLTQLRKLALRFACAASQDSRGGLVRLRGAVTWPVPGFE